jgi:hypothetical protein
MIVHPSPRCYITYFFSKKPGFECFALDRRTWLLDGATAVERRK